jgi:uncharacterized protein (TIGR03118 family)
MLGIRKSPTRDVPSPLQPRTSRGMRRRGASSLTVAVITAMTLTATAGVAVADDGHHQDEGRDRAFQQVNLVSDVDTYGAPVQDSHLRNPWGIAFSPGTSAVPGSPLWTSNQVDNTSTLFRGTSKADAQKAPTPAAPLVVSASSPTGIEFNPTTSFVLSNGQPAKFIFTETVFSAQGAPLTSITGWNGGTATVRASEPVAGFYGGLALVPARKHESRNSGPVLLAADNTPGANIDIYDSQFARVTPEKGHAFVDPHIDLVATPPYNVAYLDGRVYVSYAPPFGEAGDSAISVFTPDGKFERRLVTNHGLNGPWGMAIAPKHWGDFGGDLLVGNVFDGTIHAFNADSGHAEGTLNDSHGNPLVNVGLWGIMFGNGTIGTPNDLVFAAGVGVAPGGFDGAYEHGLVGLITPVGDRSRKG